MAQSCLHNNNNNIQIYKAPYTKLHRVINYLWPPETDQNMPLFVPLSPASTKFHKIPGKRRNSTQGGEFRGSVEILHSSENCGAY